MYGITVCDHMAFSRKEMVPFARLLARQRSRLAPAKDRSKGRLGLYFWNVPYGRMAASAGCSIIYPYHIQVGQDLQ